MSVGGDVYHLSKLGGFPEAGYGRYDIQFIFLVFSTNTHTHLQDIRPSFCMVFYTDSE